MKIAIMGAQCTGKSTLIKEFISTWPMYKTPEITYRDLIKDENLKLNKESDERTQKVILNAVIDEVQQASLMDTDFVIFDRCVLDQIAYTLWLNDNGKVSDNYVMDAKYLVSQTLKLYDLIFYVPVRPEIKMVEKENRDTDPTFQKEIDNIMDAVVLSYEKGSTVFFPREDCPAIIRLEGPPDLRVPQIKLYLKENGKCYGVSDKSLIA